MKPSISETPEQKSQIKPISLRRQKRIQEILNLIDSGWEETEIAAKYGISLRMVGYDVRDGKDLSMAMVQCINQHEIVDRVIRGYEREMRRELRAEQLSQNPLAKVAHKRLFLELRDYREHQPGIGAHHGLDALRYFLVGWSGA